MDNVQKTNNGMHNSALHSFDFNVSEICHITSLETNGLANTYISHL
jgi:hypothetical protein